MSRMSQMNENCRSTPGLDICWYYKHGSCHYGDSCWFVHGNKQSSAQKQETELAHTMNQQQMEKEKDRQRKYDTDEKRNRPNRPTTKIWKLYKTSRTEPKQLRFDTVAMNTSNQWKFRHFTDEENKKYEQQIQAEKELEMKEEETEESICNHFDNLLIDNSDNSLECEEEDFNSDSPLESDDDFVKFNANDYFFSAYDIYKKDDRIPEIVFAAMNNDLQSVRKYITNGGDLDKRKRWTEVVEKWGYDKSWEWFADSALIVAARKGLVEIVKELLLNQADPMLVSCPYDDEYNSALDVSKNQQILQMITVVNDLWKELNPNCNESAHYNSLSDAKEKPNKQQIQKAISEFL